MIDNTDLAYAAAIIDGEGSINILVSKPNRRSKRPRHFIHVSVGMTDLDAVKWLWKKWRGGFTLIHDKRRQIYRPLFYWNLSANKATSFLKQILPFLKVKYRQAKICIEFQEKLILQPEIKKRDSKGKITWTRELDNALLTKREAYRSLIRKFNSYGCIWSETLEGLPSRVIEKYQGEIQ